MPVRIRPPVPIKENMIVSKVKGKVFSLTLEGKVHRLQAGNSVNLGVDRVLLSKDTSINYRPDYSDNFYKSINYLFSVVS